MLQLGFYIVRKEVKMHNKNDMIPLLIWFLQYENEKYLFDIHVIHHRW